VTESDLLDFVRSSIRSVWTLELLLLLRRHPGRAWAPEELVRELRASEVVVGEGLPVLHAAGLVSAEPGGVYRYAPASPELDLLVRDLETLHRQRPFAVTKAIFSAPSDKLQTLADAFKLKKD
jgi:DNA-binding GntR family transcriptional regulator